MAAEADFFVEKTEEGLAVRYALGALKGVGERAMEVLVEAARSEARSKNRSTISPSASTPAAQQAPGRDAGGPVRSMRSTTIAPGCSLRPRRSSRSRAHWSNKTSGQGGLFGKSSRAAVRSSCRRARTGRWQTGSGRTRDAFAQLFLRASARPLPASPRASARARSRPWANSTSLPAPGWARRSRRLSRIAAAYPRPGATAI